MEIKKLEEEKIKSQKIREKNNLQVSTQLLNIITENDLTVEALRIMFTFMSLIDPHKPEYTLTAFRLADYAQFFGAKKKTGDLAQAMLLLSNLKITKNFSTEAIDVHVESRNLFEYCSLTHLKGSSDVHLVIACTQSAIPIFYGLEQRGYLKVYMSELANLKRKNSILLYLLLLKNTTFTRHWKVDLLELYDLLNVTDEFRAQVRKTLGVKRERKA